MQKSVLFVTYGGGHAHFVGPVVQHLKKTQAYQDGHIKINVLGMPSAKAILERYDVSCHGFIDFLDPDTDADALAWGDILAKDHHSDSVGATREESVAYLGLSYKDLITRLGSVEAEAQFALKQRQAFLPTTILQRVFDRFNPDFVVATNSPRAEAASIAVANMRNIPSLIMTGLFTGMPDYKLEAPYISFLNETAQNMLMALGVLDPEISEFFITGNPAFDPLIGTPEELLSKFPPLRFEGVDGEPLILHADTHSYTDRETGRSIFVSPEETTAEREACYQASRANGGHYLLRTHPTQSRAEAEKWISSKPYAMLVNDQDLHLLINSVNVIVVRSSTVTLEALYMRRIVLQLEPDLHPDMPVTAMGIAFSGPSLNDLEYSLKNALNNETEKNCIRNRIPTKLPMHTASKTLCHLIQTRLLSTQNNQSASKSI